MATERVEHEAERLRQAGQRYRAYHAARRRQEREDRQAARAITYRLAGLHYRLLPGQRITVPLSNGDTLILCGEGVG